MDETINNLKRLIGKTPVVDIDGIKAKLETTNPSGSVKDRMAGHMIAKAEERGELKPRTSIIEATSGNTGIAFAMAAAAKGYRFTAVMPESMSPERRRMMEGYGAEVKLTPGEDDMKGALEAYEELARERPDAWLPRQFDNPDNPEAHEHGLGKELANQVPDMDVFVAGIGTGGTIIGAARALKRAKPDVKVIGVEPAESAVLHGQEPGKHAIQGIGEGFVPKIVEEDKDLIDEVVTVTTEEATDTRNELAREYGLLVGTSAGANVAAARKLKSKYGKITTILPDRGERYLSESRTHPSEHGEQ